jgi:hypothetical protein
MGKDLDVGADAARSMKSSTTSGGGSKSSEISFSSFKKKIIIMAVIYLQMDNGNDMMLISTDDSLIRAWHHNGSVFVPLNSSEQMSDNEFKILVAKQP